MGRIIEVGENEIEVLSYLFTEGSLEEKLKMVLENEIRRRIVEYQFVDMMFQKKYGMTLEEFERNGVIEKMGFSFDVENDYHEWDSAIDAIETLKILLERIGSK